MKKLFLLVVLLLPFACSKKDPNQAFDSFKDDFINNLWKMYPEWASSAGYHHYDSILTINNQEYRDRQLKFADDVLAQLATFDVEGLSKNNKTDFRIIENQLKSLKWYINEERSYEWDPSGYNVTRYFAEMLGNNYDSLDARLRNFKLRLAFVPAIYDVAKKNIKNPTKEHTELAIAQNLGGSSVFDADLKAALEKSHLSDSEKQEILNGSAIAVKAINDYVEWLKNLDNQNPRTFRLGKICTTKNLSLIFNRDIPLMGFIRRQLTGRTTCTKKWEKWLINCGQNILEQRKNLSTRWS